jgi:hypothetical protein
VYREVINDALLVVQAYESLVIGDIMPFIKILKTFLLTRSRKSLSLADESMLQAIVENLLPLRYRIPELALVMDGEKSKGSGRYGFSDIFILKETAGDNYVSLELKYISLFGLVRNQKDVFGANELEKLDKTLEKENEEYLLKRTYEYWSKEQKKTIQIDDRVKVIKSNSNKLKGFVILVVGFRRILWRPTKEVVFNYIYNKV